jgi:cobalt-zinc-cadmium resistance protein CzcA
LRWPIRVVTLGGAGLLFGAAMFGVHSLGVEFLPHLEEGNLFIRAELPPSISLEAGSPPPMRSAAASTYPEIERVLSTQGRPDDGTDPTGFFNAEFFVPLKPQKEWPAGMDKDKLVAQLNKDLTDRFPGVDFSFSQIIEDNVAEAASGVKGANSVKLFGPDLDTLQKIANQIKDEMSKVRASPTLACSSRWASPPCASMSTAKRRADMV